MDTTVQVAIIAAAASVVGALVTFILTKHADRRDALQQRKLNHYHELLGALSDIAITGSNDEARRRFAQAVNTIALVAPQPVISAIMELHNANMKSEDCAPYLNRLLLEIRGSLELPFEDNPSTFDFHLIGAALPTKMLEGRQSGDA